MDELTATEEAKREAQAYLDNIKTTLLKTLTDEAEVGNRLVKLDIDKCRIYADFGLAWALERDKIKRACDVLGIDEDKWCRNNLGRSIVTLLGYRQLAKSWDTYVESRIELGDCGASGVDLGKSLIRDADATSNRIPRVCGEGGLDMSRVTFITSDALSALRKMPDKSAHVIPTSPPYWPLRRQYGGSFGGLAIGWENTPQEYVRNNVVVFHEAKRVLHPRGTLIVVMRDAYSLPNGARYRQHTHKLKRPGEQKLWLPDGTPIQRGDSTGWQSTVAAFSVCHGDAGRWLDSSNDASRAAQGSP